MPKIWCERQFPVINIHFVIFTDKPLFASKPTYARIVFLRQGERLVNRKGTHNVKFLTENHTKEDYAVYTRMCNSAENTHAYSSQRKWLEGMLRTADGHSIM